MFRQTLRQGAAVRMGLVGRRLASSQGALPRFASGAASSGKKASRAVPLAIFGASFCVGWFFTQHMTFTDLIAWWRYDTLPATAPEVRDYQASLVARAEQLPVVKQLKSKGYVEVFANAQGENRLITSALSSPGAIAVAPKFYYNPETKETVGLYHLGMKLTGYPFIVHGGVLATVMEDLMREAVCVVRGGEMRGLEKTRDLNVSYKFPTFANQFVVVRTTDVETFGKGLKMRCEVMDQTGNNQLVTGGAVFST